MWTGSKTIHKMTMALWIPYIFVLLCVLCQPSQASVLEFSVRDMFVELATWGTVTIGRYNVKSTDPFSRHIDGSLTTIDIKEVRLLDSSHKVVHSYSLRDSQKRVFTISRWQGSDLWSLGASGRSMEASDLEGISGSVQLKVHLFTEDGLARYGATDHMVHPGDIHVDIGLEGITQCDTCYNVAFVELILGIKGNNGLAENVHMYDQHQGTRIEVPGSAILYVNEQVKLDGHVIDMADGFPEVETEASHVEVITRFPRFSTSGSYGMFIKPDRRDPKLLKETMPTRTQELDRYTTVSSKTQATVLEKKSDTLQSKPEDPQVHGKPEAAIDTSGQTILYASLCLAIAGCVINYLIINNNSR